MSILEVIKQAVIEGNAPKTKEATEKALAEGFSPSAILSDGLIAAMDVIGPRFKNNEIYVPEVLIAARALHAGMDIVKPLLAQAGIKEKGTVLVGTVKGDLHDIGKNIVVMMLDGAGYKVIDLGVDVSSDKFTKAVEEYQPQIVGMSALLTTTMMQMKSSVEQLKSQQSSVKIIVGGAPVTAKFAAEIGADGYAPDAASAVEIVNELLARSL